LPVDQLEPVPHDPVAGPVQNAVIVVAVAESLQTKHGPTDEAMIAARFAIRFSPMFRPRFIQPPGKQLMLGDLPERR
jgi:hypothetical protein